MYSITDPLATFPLFASLSSTDRIELAQRFTRRRFNAHRLICDRNSKDSDVWFLLEGRVSISNFARNGREIAIAEFGPGDFFGEIAAIDGKPRSASVTARTDCVVLVLTADRFHTMVVDYPELGWHIMQRLSTLIRATNERLQSVSTQSVTQRVCQEILNLCVPSPVARDHHIVHPVPTQADLGTKIGASRETVARVLLDLAGDGIVMRKGRTLTIPDRDNLQAMVDGMRPVREGAKVA
ncbi:Crp/Fnr family transcriptional regulator [Roseospira marina]|uniref:Crp/Fnr family transcriptional regulator n=1 Tax=Roseospira marina TaxID=140057 RepID=A0A5M6IGY3_9PROT|nr:Crp/Fnr family transcriptional regulator [Roseospira marina]KAA5607560.1 Crp/Fnr family transcriptional regulator [Roseospira marina]MBB4312252.1 CRP-like cAMP-binding protein [Roseospira marina]MBB5085732.1 CRP-like cAMP-binding protein [Roseospira marina]